MARLKSGSPFLYDDGSDDIIGLRDPDGSEYFFGRDVVVDPRYYGAKFDGNASDAAANTAAMQKALDRVVASGGALLVPAGTLDINAALTIGFSQGWKIAGQGQMRTTIRQRTSNTPIFRFTHSLTHTFRIEGIGFDWATQQTSSEPNSVAMYFDGPTSATWFNFVVQDCRFANGYRGIALNPASDSLAIWGVTIRDCTSTSTMTGALLRAKCNTAVGQPNINLDNIYIDCAGATEASIQGAALTQSAMRCVEFNNGTYNTFRQIEIESSQGISVIACRSEVPVVSTSGTKTLWSFPNTDVVLVGCQIGDPQCSGGGVLQGVSAGANGTLSMLGMQFTGSRGDGGSLVPYTGTKIEMVSNLVLTGGWVRNPRTVLGNVEMPSIETAVMTADATQTRGDVSVTLAATDYRFQYFNTTLTANRTVTLPNSGLLDGQEFHIVRWGLGAFTLQVVDPVGGKNYTIASATRGFARYRAVGTGEWLLIEAGTLP
ncbi:MAG: hypothetical protein KA200_00160 [Burkholderiales bacterium]|nr:hypothetical protein [Burkholderiales bacterium]